MKRMFRVLLAVSLVFALALSLVGCSDEQDAANAAMDAANAATDEANLLDGEIGKILGDLPRLDATAEQSKAALEPLAQAEAKLAEKNAKIDAAVLELGKIAGLDVDEDYKTYVAQQQEIVKLQMKSDELIGRLLATLTEAHTAIAAGEFTDELAAKVNGEIDAIAAESEALDEQIAEKANESDDFYEEMGFTE